MATMNTIATDSNWGTEATKINQNFTNLNMELVKLGNTYGIKVPLCNSVDEAKTLIKNPYDGQFVLIGTSLPASVYKWNGTEWQNTGITGGDSSVALENYYTKKETLTYEDNGDL